MKAARGFTLIEVMITMVILGILAAIAIPNYADYVTRGRIPEATNALSDMRIKMEQFFQDNRTYVAAGACGAPIPTGLSKFAVTCAATATTYTATATGTGAMAGFNYQINQLGARTTQNVPNANWGATPVNCWVVRKGGGC